MKTPHTSTWKGKRVYVRLKSGREFVDKFMEKTGNYVIFKEQGKINRGEIAAFSIYRQPPHERIVK